MLKYFSILVPFIFFSSVSFAQKLTRDTTFVFSARENTINIYTQTMKEQTQLINGGDYIDYKPLKEEHPYFISEDWITGSIQYNGELYNDISLLYNIHSDHVITEQSSSYMIQLVNDKIQSFTMNGHTFVMIRGKELPDGFYDQLCNGKVILYAKRIKEFQETISAAELQRNFIEKTKYYLYKDGHFYPVKNKKSVLNVLGDRKRELNQFIHQNHLHFSENREAAILNVTEFYNGN